MEREQLVCRNRQVFCGIGFLAAIAFAHAVGSAQPVLYVDDSATGANNGSSWCDAYVYLQDALAAARASGESVTEIRVAQGTYKPDRGATQTPGDRAGSFELVNGLALRGSCAGCGAPDPDYRDISGYPTVLSGDLNGDDAPNLSNCCYANGGGGCDDASCQAIVCASRSSCCALWDDTCSVYASNLCPTLCGGIAENSLHILTVGSECAHAEISGVVVTAGNADSPAGVFYAGGLLVETGADLEVTMTHFRHNRAQYGAAVYARGTVRFTDCLFVGNEGGEMGAAIYSQNADVTLIRSSFIDNATRHEASRGGAFFGIWGSRLMAIDCIFAHNRSRGSGGAIALDSQVSQARLIRCILVGNLSRLEGGACHLFGNISVDDSIIAGNQTSNHYGGGVCHNDGTLTVSNSSIVGNVSPFYGGGIRTYGFAHVRNSILWGNADQTGSSEQAQLGFGAVAPNVGHTLVEAWTGGLGGIGNIGGDPLFVGGLAGTWTTTGVYDPDVAQTTFRNASAGYQFGGLAGKFLNPNTSQYLQSLIVGNTGTTITVWGNSASIGSAGATYKSNDYRLSSGSPCIDAGDNSAVSADTFDLDNDGNTTEPIPFDLDGNPRFEDDPATPDGGAGSPPIVDMGAWEYQGCMTNADCDDADPCNGLETCVNYACEPGTPIVCDDGNPCNGTESCDATGSCVRTLSFDCNGNGIEDACDIGGGTSSDCQTDGIPDECQLQGNDCNLNLRPDECDIDSGGSFDANANGIPDECEPWACCAPDGFCETTLLGDCDSPLWVEGLACAPNRCPIPPIVAALGGRYLSVTPQSWEPNEMVAIRISSPQFPCLSKYVARDYGIGRVIDNPVFLPASGWGTVYVADTEIVPATTYEVQTENAIGLSHAATATTPLWGDVADRIGIVDALDIVGFVDRFKSRPGSPPLEACDLHPAIPNQVVDALDITMAVDAFKGFSYPFPLPCP